MGIFSSKQAPGGNWVNMNNLEEPLLSNVQPVYDEIKKNNNEIKKIKVEVKNLMDNYRNQHNDIQTVQTNFGNEIFGLKEKFDQVIDRIEHLEHSQETLIKNQKIFSDVLQQIVNEQPHQSQSVYNSMMSLKKEPQF